MSACGRRPARQADGLPWIHAAVRPDGRLPNQTPSTSRGSPEPSPSCGGVIVISGSGDTFDQAVLGRRRDWARDRGNERHF